MHGKSPPRPLPALARLPRRAEAAITHGGPQAERAPRRRPSLHLAR
ncbi:hypothetical protein CSE45_4191 [Citreicella sp. SE45]|nr:hypothetical protein CSE45_4191 [Citreicella sp. SE45]